MSLSLVGTDNVVELRDQPAPHQRPHTVGLLPGRVIAGVFNPEDGERLLGATPYSLHNGGRMIIERPHGLWRWSEIRRELGSIDNADGSNSVNGALTWLGSRTDSHAPRKEWPPTYVRLASVLARLAKDDVVLVRGSLLHGGGWRRQVPAEILAFQMMRPAPSNYVGFSGTFNVGADLEEWQAEFYTNGMFWADTPTRLDILGTHVAGAAILK